MYLSTETVTQKRKSADRQMIVAGIFVLAGLYGIVRSLLGDTDLRQCLLTYVILVVIFLLPFLLGVFNRKQLKLTRRLNDVLVSSATDRVSIHDLAQQVTLSEEKTLSEVKAILERGYLSHCTLEEDGEPTLLLSRGTAEE